MTPFSTIQSSYRFSERRSKRPFGAKRFQEVLKEVSSETPAARPNDEMLFFDQPRISNLAVLIDVRKN